jgi:hypothetical protein
MARFSGRLQGSDLEPSTVVIEIDDDRLRISAGRRQLGSWAIEKITAERTSIYRFDVDIDGDRFEFFPDDPSAFSNAVGAVIDLTESKGRFGLKARIEKAASSG